MENIKLNIEKIQDNELIIRTGAAKKELDPKEPQTVGILGVLSSSLDWLKKRFIADGDGIDTIDGIAINQCHVIVNREDMSIELVIDEKNYYEHSIKGALSMHPKFKDFCINTGRMFEPKKLGDFFKMNRTYFSSREENMDVVTKLKSLLIKTQQELSKSDNNRGNIDMSFKQNVLDSNLPESFKLRMPIFKGMPAQDFDVELYAHIDGAQTYVSLVSPAASELVEEHRNTCIDAVIDEIKELAPNLVVIEI